MNFQKLKRLLDDRKRFWRLLPVSFLLIVCFIIYGYVFTDSNYIVPLKQHEVDPQFYTRGVTDWIFNSPSQSKTHLSENVHPRAFHRPTLLLSGECLVSTTISESPSLNLPVPCLARFRGPVLVIPWFSFFSAHSPDNRVTPQHQQLLLSLLRQLQASPLPFRIVVLYDEEDDPSGSSLSFDFLLRHSTHQVMFLHTPAVVSLPQLSPVQLHAVKTLVLARALLRASPEITHLAVLKLHVSNSHDAHLLLQHFVQSRDDPHARLSYRTAPSVPAHRAFPLWLSAPRAVMLEVLDEIYQQVQVTKLFSEFPLQHGVALPQDLASSLKLEKSNDMHNHNNMHPSSLTLSSSSLSSLSSSSSISNMTIERPTYLPSGDCFISLQASYPGDPLHCIPLSGDVIFTTFITGDTTYSKGTPYEPRESEDEYFVTWMSSVAKHDLRAVILYNNLDHGLMLRHTSHHVIWRRLSGHEQFSSNDRRFFILRAITQHEEGMSALMLTDLRDIVFHADPFSHLYHPRQAPFHGSRNLPAFFVGLDEKKFTVLDNIGNQKGEPGNHYCYPQFPPHDLAEFSDLHLLNAGISMGQRATMLRFLDDFEKETIHLIGHNPPPEAHYNCNMGVFNVIALRLFKNSVVDLYFGEPFSTYLKSALRTDVTHKEATYSNAFWLKRTLYEWWYHV